ncbi:MAG: LysR substrate-binding domain-containing protein, partial [Pseudomonadota bacterium]
RISPSNAWWEAWDNARRAERAGMADAAVLRGLQFDSQVLDAAAAMSGNGIAILSSNLFSAETADGRLQRIGNAMVWPGGKYRLVYPEVRRHSAKVRAFKAWLMEEVKALLSDEPDGLEGIELGSPL